MNYIASFLSSQRYALKAIQLNQYKPAVISGSLVNRGYNSNSETSKL